MPVQFASKSASGNTVTVQVNNTNSITQVVKVTVEATVDGEPVILVSGWTSIPANSTAPVNIDAGAPVTFTVDQPDPTITVKGT